MKEIYESLNDKYRGKFTSKGILLLRLTLIDQIKHQIDQVIAITNSFKYINTANNGVQLKCLNMKLQIIELRQKIQQYVYS